ncbi:hypothetical protein [Hwanghaeella sp.]|uniref:hypothetical protein n=1 Tax=Hwanghaeella sp. TaxID=2605943 RepID=UPI003CCBD6AF
MGGLFSAPKPPPPSPEDDVLKQQLDMQKQERERTKQANDARLRNLRRRGQRRPLLFSGFAGVEDGDRGADTLG